MSPALEPLFHFAAFPTLETERLRLREITPGDAPAIFAIRGDYAVTRLNIGPAYRFMSEAERLIAAIAEAYRNQTELRWGITCKPDDTVIGMCGFNYWDRHDRRASVGFDLARAYWRQGIMREALQVVLHFGFVQMGLNRIEADCSAENVASAGLLQACGFVQEGRQREQYYEDEAYYDLLLFGLLRREWEAQR